MPYQQDNDDLYWWVFFPGKYQIQNDFKKYYNVKMKNVVSKILRQNDKNITSGSSFWNSKFTNVTENLKITPKRTWIGKEASLMFQKSFKML